MQARSPGSPKRVLFIAYHFPPLQGSTGIVRTLSFAKYLREWNWEVTVLTVRPNVYPEVRQQNLASIPSHVRVVRSRGFDTQKHFSIFGRYPSFLAVPDKLQSWIPFGYLEAKKIVREWAPDAIMSTYPMASAHCIGYLIHKHSGLPWIADFRDPMAQDDYPPDPRLHRAFEKIEKKIFGNAARVLVTTPGAARLYRERFPEYGSDRVVLLSNGFDPEMFPESAASQSSKQSGPFTFLHSGLLYPEERNPEYFFQGVAELLKEKRIAPDKVRFVFRAAGNEAAYQRDLDRHGLNDIVKFEPPIPYKDAVEEMGRSDALMIFQASNCNQQIPAKLYEYLYCQKPILGLADPAGDTGVLMRQLGVSSVAALESKEAIKSALVDLLGGLASGRVAVVPRSEVLKFSRRELTGNLAALLSDVVLERR